MFGHLFETDAAQVRPLATYLRAERPKRVPEAGTVHSYSSYGAGLAGAALERCQCCSPPFRAADVRPDAKRLASGSRRLE